MFHSLLQGDGRVEDQTDSDIGYLSVKIIGLAFTELKILFTLLKADFDAPPHLVMLHDLDKAQAGIRADDQMPLLLLIITHQEYFHLYALIFYL